MLDLKLMEFLVKV